jgi:hypothetical protein
MLVMLPLLASPSQVSGEIHEPLFNGEMLRYTKAPHLMLVMLPSLVPLMRSTLGSLKYGSWWRQQQQQQQQCVEKAFHQMSYLQSAGIIA